MSKKEMAASVRAKLLNKARSEKLEFNHLLTRFGLERMLYRLSVSDYRDQFLLKGALLFDLWFDIPHRPTRDADFLGFCSTELPQIESIFRKICSIDVDDGVYFKANTVQASKIRKDARYAGVRVTFLGILDNARCPIQVDIGFGDVVTPRADLVEYPLFLTDLPQPKLLTYSRYTVVAEKFEAIVSLGIANSRMKDYFDLWILSKHCEFDNDILKQAIHATFNRRNTALQTDVPFGLTEAFYQNTQKQTQWKAFIKKNDLDVIALEEVIECLKEFLCGQKT